MKTVYQLLPTPMKKRLIIFPYLSSFQVMKIQTRFQMEGISKRTVSLEDQKKMILEGKDIEEINFEGTQLEKQVISTGTNTLIVKNLWKSPLKTPMVFYRAKQFSVHQKPMRAEWKKYLISSILNTKENLRRCLSPTIRGIRKRRITGSVYQ